MSASPPTELTVVRHGETVWNVEGRQQGQLDTELSELGVRQAKAIAEALVGERFNALYSSDLGRAMRTADVIAARLGLEVIPEAGLRERHLGNLQGLTMAQYEQRHPEDYARFRSHDPDYVIPGGESARQRYERGVACVAGLAEKHVGRQLLIVTHGGILDSLFRHTLGLPIEAPRRFSLFNASINRFAVADGTWRLDGWGDVRHLADMGTIDDG